MSRVARNLQIVLVLMGMCDAVRGGAAESKTIPDSHPLTPDLVTPGGELRILYPFEGAVFPRDIAPPTFRWRSSVSSNEIWRVSLAFEGGGGAVAAIARETCWTPDSSTWESIKSRSLGKRVTLTVIRHDDQSPGQPGPAASRSFSTSADPVEAPIFYRDVNLPFSEAVKDPSTIRWRFGPISDTNPPPVVLENLPVCGNCHSFSANGSTLGMDVDYANSKGSYLIAGTAREMTLQQKDIITWDDYKREDGELTFGLLSQVSPDGEWVVSTVKDKSVFVPRPDLAFSQLFFPIKGILALYHRSEGKFRPLHGADDPAYVQSNPAWSPDGRYLVFARAKAYNLTNTAGQGKVLLTPEECREFTRDGKPFLFDLYRVPFNGGQGGTAQPLAGAAGDGFSNFFPKYSPDGRWIVFCKARSYMLLQPDSELYLIPAEGGAARRLHCNLSRMNSWHSWSPNSRWLVFSSKALSDYTQLFLTHIDERGESSPPVLLDRFTTTNRAANIPEFVNLPVGSIVKMEGRFLNDYSFERAGNEFYRAGDPEHAIEKYRKALELNPNNVVAHQRLGFLLYHVTKQFKEGAEHTASALRLDPKNGFAHGDMGVILLHQNRPDQSIPHLLAALQSLPASAESQYKPQMIRTFLGKAHLQQGQYPEASVHFSEAVRLDDANSEAHYLLALALACQGDTEDAAQHCAKAVALRPQIDTSVRLHEALAENYAKAGRYETAVRSAEHALQIARATGKNDLASRIKTRLAGYRAALAH